MTVDSSQNAYTEALRRFPDFWRSRTPLLEKLIGELRSEISLFEKSSRQKLNFSKQEASSIKAVWSFSGSGSYEKKLTNSPSDLLFRNKKWYYGTDRLRLEKAAEIIFYLTRVLADKGAVAKNDRGKLIEKFGPYLIYNGIPEQINALLKQAGSSYLVPSRKIHIPEGRVVKTLDQVKNFSFPFDLKLKKADRVGLVSHAPHLPRIIRMISNNSHILKGTKPVLFPISLKDPAEERKFSEEELSGTLDYIAKGEADCQPYPYTI